MCWLLRMKGDYRSIIKRGLIEEGYAVDAVYDGEEAQYMAETTSYDIIILDIMLPKKDGIAVCKDLRAKKINTPILDADRPGQC